MRITVLLLLLVLVPLGAETYFVSVSGNDSWSGTSPDSAFATLQHAADMTVAGDSVLALNGSYAGFDLRHGGTETQPIVFAADGSSVWIDSENPVTDDGINIEGADWVTVDGFNLTGLDRNGIRVALSDNVTLRNCYAEYCYERGIFTGFCDWITIEDNECCYSIDEHGIYHSNSGDHPVIRHNVCHHNNGCGIHMNGDLSSGGDGIISDATVEGNIIFENGQGGGSGINCDGVVESRIYNNLLYMNHSSGISLYRIDGATGSHHVEVYNNTIVQPDDGRWGVNINTGSTNATLLNNIVLSAHSYRGSISIDGSSATGFQSDFNLLENRLSADGGNTVISLVEWQALGYDAGSEVCVGWDQTFEDWPSGDYHCQSSSQPVDSGSSIVQGVVLDDLDGVPRPQGSAYDMGCYERYPQGISGGGTGGTGGIEVLGEAGSFVFTGVPAGSDIMIFDLSGRVLLRLWPEEGVAVWSTEGIPRGVYLFTAGSEESNAHSGRLILLR